MIKIIILEIANNSKKIDAFKLNEWSIDVCYLRPLTSQFKCQQVKVYKIYIFYYYLQVLLIKSTSLSRKLFLFSTFSKCLNMLGEFYILILIINSAKLLKSVQILTYSR